MSVDDTIRFDAATDVGRHRRHNEDNYLVDRKLGLFVVADGMGGHAAGEVASAIAVRTMHEELKREQLYLAERARAGMLASKDSREIVNLVESAVQRSCASIHSEARVDPAKRGMGTTLSALLLVGKQGYVGHVGDSRIYLLRSGRVQQITEDHTIYNELLRRGRLPREQIERFVQKNAITRAVGVYERVEVDTLVVEVLPGDVFLLASDGITGYLRSQDELRTYLSGKESPARALVELANQRGGRDNSTAVVIYVGQEGADQTRVARLSQKRKVLAQMPIFSRLTERELLRIMQAVELRNYAEGDAIFREGEPGNELFIVLSGKVRVFRGDSPLGELGPGEHFGEMALMRDVPRSASVTARELSEVLVMRRTEFFEILRTEHEIGVKILWQFLGVLADRLDQTSVALTEARAGSTQTEAVELFPEVDAHPSQGPNSEASLNIAELTPRRPPR